MFVQIIESRYTVDHDILKSYLKDLFGEGKFEIIVSMLKQEEILNMVNASKQPPDEGEKWRVRIPREMIRVCC
jgi:hypothetical protein